MTAACGRVLRTNTRLRASFWAERPSPSRGAPWTLACALIGQVGRWLWPVANPKAIKFESDLHPLNQLVAVGLVPIEIHAGGRRMYRREQMLTVANAREARWH